MKTADALRMVGVGFCVIAGFVAGTREARSYAEESLLFRDPATALLTDDAVSSLHSDLTYAMALAAGFSEADAAWIALWDQLVDSEKLGPGGDVTYTNCLGSVKPGPTPAASCPSGAGAGTVVWPMTYDSGCTTSRFGPYSPFFHFPHDTPEELGALRDWAWGRTPNLFGYAAYAWGDPADNVLNADCRITQWEEIDTGIAAGSLEAFGTFLHSLGDSFSHSDCLAALDALNQPYLWGTHTILPSTVGSCYYVPTNPKNSDVHGQEFGSGGGTGRADDGVVATYDELIDRAVQKEGRYLPIDLDATLDKMDGKPTLRTALINFVHNWDYEKAIGDKSEYAANRRAHADQIVAAVLAQRKSAAKPTLASLKPSSAHIAGQSKDYKLTVAGESFIKYSVVKWKGIALTTTYKSSKKLTAIVPASYFAKPGKAKITVYNPCGGGTSKSKKFTYD